MREEKLLFSFNISWGRKGSRWIRFKEILSAPYMRERRYLKTQRLEWMVVCSEIDVLFKIDMKSLSVSTSKEIKRQKTFSQTIRISFGCLSLKLLAFVVPSPCRVLWDTWIQQTTFVETRQWDIWDTRHYSLNLHCQASSPSRDNNYDISVTSSGVFFTPESS